MTDKEKVVDNLTDLKEMLKLQKDIKGYGIYIDFINDAISMLKEQEERIEQLEYDLAVTQDSLYYYLNGND